MKRIDLMYQTVLAELGQRVFDASFLADFPDSGRFVQATVKNKQYWYFDTPTNDGKQARRYVGPADDPAITERVETHKALKEDRRARRKLVTTLTAHAGLPQPEKRAGDIIEALADAGFFRLRGVLVGTAAYQCYSGILGVGLPSASMITGDADFAQDFAISAEVLDSIPPILDVLHKVDETFRAIPHRSGSPQSSAFQTRDGYRVEFLTSNRGSDEYSDKPANMPALGGASADPLRFLDFLIYQPVRTVLLHRAGVNVLVPAPARYAVHKLIVASRRLGDQGGLLKQEKDIAQAGSIVEAMALTRRMDDLEEAFEEAWERGPGWRDALLQGVGRLSSDTAKILRGVIGNMRAAERVHGVDFNDIRAGDFRNLRSICAELSGDQPISRAEAWNRYRENWFQVDQSDLNAEERGFILSLQEEFGGRLLGLDYSELDETVPTITGPGIKKGR